METFHFIVLSVAVVLLIVILTIVGIILSNQKQSTVFPPTVSTCPDYWVVSQDGSGCVIPKSNAKNIGSIYGGGSTISGEFANTTSTPGYKSLGADSIVNFDDAGWKGICSKKTWTTKNQISWDGISNYNAC